MCVFVERKRETETETETERERQRHTEEERRKKEQTHLLFDVYFADNIKQMLLQFF
jgi:hypothetical protein